MVNLIEKAVGGFLKVHVCRSIDKAAALYMILHTRRFARAIR